MNNIVCPSNHSRSKFIVSIIMRLDVFLPAARWIKISTPRSTIYFEGTHESLFHGSHLKMLHRYVVAEVVAVMNCALDIGTPKKLFDSSSVPQGECIYSKPLVSQQGLNIRLILLIYITISLKFITNTVRWRTKSISLWSTAHRIRMTCAHKGQFVFLTSTIAPNVYDTIDIISCNRIPVKCLHLDVNAHHEYVAN